MKRTIKVTNKNITEGEMVNPQNCAVARSLKDNIRNLQSVSVLVDHIRIKFKNGRTSCAKTPKAAVVFIKKFDKGEPVNKTEFKLNFV